MLVAGRSFQARTNANRSGWRCSLAQASSSWSRALNFRSTVRASRLNYTCVPRTPYISFSTLVFVSSRDMSTAQRIAATLCAAVLCLSASPAARQPATTQARSLSTEDDAFLEDLSRRSVHVLLGAGGSRDRHRPRPLRTRRRPVRQHRFARHRQHRVGGLRSYRDVHRGGAWLAAAGSDRSARASDAASSSPRKSPHEHGWFYHFVNLHTGAREWQSELSSIDTALLLGGVLTVRRCFDADRDIVRLCRGDLPGASISRGCSLAAPESCRTAGSRSPASSRGDGITTAS